MDGLLPGFGGSAGFARICTDASPSVVLERTAEEAGASVLPRTAGADGRPGIWDLRRGGGKGGGAPAPLSKEHCDTRDGSCSANKIKDKHINIRRSNERLWRTRSRINRVLYCFKSDACRKVRIT